MTVLGDHVLAALDSEFRTAADIARRAGVDATSAAPALGHLRQHGLVQWRQQTGTSLWRRQSTPHRATDQRNAPSQ